MEDGRMGGREEERKGVVKQIPSRRFPLTKGKDRKEKERYDKKEALRAHLPPSHPPSTSPFLHSHLLALPDNPPAPFQNANLRFIHRNGLFPDLGAALDDGDFAPQSPAQNAATAGDEVDGIFVQDGDGAAVVLRVFGALGARAGFVIFVEEAPAAGDEMDGVFVHCGSGSAPLGVQVSFIVIAAVVVVRQADEDGACGQGEQRQDGGYVVGMGMREWGQGGGGLGEID